MRNALPLQGRPWPELRAEMQAPDERDVAWRHGRAAVDVINAGAEIEAAWKEACALFISESGLGPSAFPSLKRG